MAAFAIFAALGLFLSSANAQNCTPLNPSAPLKISDGYTAQVILNGLKSPRDIVLDTAGNLLVTEQGGAGIRRVVLTESDGNLNHGLALSQDGKTLFVSNMASVSAYPYDAEAGTVGTKKTLIEGMRSGGHITRTLLIPSSAPDVLLISRGSDGNIDNSTIDVTSGKSIIKSFKISELLASETATDYATGGEVLGWGLRNSVGVGEDPSTGGIVRYTEIWPLCGSLTEEY
ncbi:hypothetical protein Daesc_010575 [Daldinia eschscholtzii]|uniref:Pyrroloquinoline quinone-dependent pyranose dehydrogenase beta-propeller domain-containing protein n=1 Tax=Daldinia eschscholtzii TaxID=292717 RepID=A0AAX6M8M4_9PEZI